MEKVGKKTRMAKYKIVVGVLAEQMNAPGVVVMECWNKLSE